MPETVPNLRDLGGLPTTSGSRVRSGLVLRSAVPFIDDQPTPGINWPPQVVIDLRSAHETVQEHPLTGTATSIHLVPLLAALSPEAWGVATLRELYLYVLKDAPDRLAEVVHLIAEAEGPSLIHCAAGKDRTGISAALLLRLLGVDRDVVIADYLATRDNEAAIRRRVDAIRKGPPIVPPEFLLTPLDAIEAVLDSWDAHPFGVVGWARDAGVEADAVEYLRERLLSDHVPTL